MTTNPYAPPTAMVADVLAPDDVQQEPFFYPCSRLKLVVLGTVTFGIYTIWWFWSQWRAEAPHDGRGSAALRTIFSGFFFYTMARQAKEEAEKFELKCRYSPAVLTAVVWAVAIATRLGPDVVTLMSGLLIVLSLLPVQGAINRVHSEIHGRRPAGWTWWEMAAAVLFGLFWFLITIGLVLADVPGE